MHDLIRRTARWVCFLFAAGNGKHRCPAVAHPHPHPNPDPAPVVAPSTPPAPAPAPRSPYGLHVLIDGAATCLVRPYLLAQEQPRAPRQGQVVPLRPRRALLVTTGHAVYLHAHLAAHLTATARTPRAPHAPAAVAA